MRVCLSTTTTTTQVGSQQGIFEMICPGGELRRLALERQQLWHQAFLVVTVCNATKAKLFNNHYFHSFLSTHPSFLFGGSQKGGF